MVYSSKFLSSVLHNGTMSMVQNNQELGHKFWATRWCVPSFPHAPHSQAHWKVNELTTVFAVFFLF